MRSTSVVDTDPYVFGPPGFGSVSQRYGSGSCSFYHHAKMLRKPLFLLFCDIFITFYLRKMTQMYLQKIISRKIVYITGSGSGSIGQRHGSVDPEPYQNVKDPWIRTRTKMSRIHNTEKQTQIPLIFHAYMMWHGSNL
jgi:hypothetical protein